MGSRWSVCVCVWFPFAKSFDVFFGVVGNLRQIMYLCQENPQILGILQRLIAIREQIIIIIFISKRAFVLARKYLGQGDNCLHLTDLRSNLRYSAVACDQAEVLKWISESVHLPPAPFHPPHRNPIYFISTFGTANLRVGEGRRGVGACGVLWFSWFSGPIGFC